MEIQTNSIEISGNGNYHDVGLDITFFLSPPLTATQSASIVLASSFFECCGNGFEDQPFLSGSISPPSLPGDVDDDNFVGGSDLTQVLSNWGNSGLSWDDGDVDPYPDGDDFIGGGDYTAVLAAWGTSTPPEATTIPEPATLGLLLLGGLAMLRRRHSA